MRHLETKPMVSFNDTQIDKPDAFSVVLSNGNELDYNDIISATPAVTSEYDGVARPQLVLGTEEGLPRWDEARFYPVGRLATFHGRNLEVLADRVSIQDRFGNLFRSLCIKGSDFSDPHLFKSGTASREYIVHGLQESLVMERILRASKLLREHGIGTEYICGLSLPESFPLDKQGKAFDDKTPTPFGEFLETLSARFAAENQNGKSALEIKTEMIDRFDDCDYLITYRAFDCPYRFGELLRSEKFAEFKDFLKKDTDDPKEIERIEGMTLSGYIAGEFNRNLASNLAKLHNLGLTHGFLHRDNITALGSIVDLDSCKGEPLDLGDERDDKARHKDEIEDLFDCMQGIGTVVSHARDHEISNQGAVEQFLATYIRKRFESTEEQEVFILRLLGDIYTATYLSDDASAMHEFAELVFGAYVELHPEITEMAREDIELPEEKIDTHLRRSDFTVFSLLPTALLKSVRKQALKDPTPVPDTELRGGTYQDAALNNMKLMVKNQLLLHMAIEFLVMPEEDGKEPLSVPQIMVALGCMLGELKPDTGDEEIDEQFEKMQREYFDEQNKQFWSRLVKYNRPDRINAEPLDILSPETQRELRDFTSYVWLGVPRSPLLYLKDERQYAKVLHELGVDADTEIEFVNMRGVQETQFLGDDTIVIADYTKASLIACHYHKDYALSELYNHNGIYDGSVKPTLMVRNIWHGKLGKPKVQVIYHSNDGEEVIREKVTYQDLLEKVMPKTTLPRQLNFRDELTAKIHGLVPTNWDQL